jgi:hypothetical protein
MPDYSLLAVEAAVLRNTDGAVISNDPADPDRIAYNTWVSEGGVPDVQTLPLQLTVFDHENRLRALEGLPPLSLDEFVADRTGASDGV